MGKTGGKTGDIFYRPFLRRLERRALADVITKAALSPQYSVKTLRVGYLSKV